MTATPGSSATTGRKATLSSHLADKIGAAILSGALAPGEKVNLDRLRAAHDTSASPLREAMMRLVASGLVDFEDQRGYRVAAVSAANLAEITMLRQESEALALRCAIARGTLDWEAAVIGALHRLERTPCAPNDPAADRWQDAHRRFHLALIAGADLPLLAQVCAKLLTLAERYQRRFPAAPGGAPRDADAHRAIAEAAVARDLPRAEALLRSHIAQGGARLLAALPAAPDRSHPRQPSSGPTP